MSSTKTKKTRALADTRLEASSSGMDSFVRWRWCPSVSESPSSVLYLPSHSYGRRSRPLFNNHPNYPFPPPRQDILKLTRTQWQLASATQSLSVEITSLCKNGHCFAFSSSSSFLLSEKTGPSSSRATLEWILIKFHGKAVDHDVWIRAALTFILINACAVGWADHMDISKVLKETGLCWKSLKFVWTN